MSSPLGKRSPYSSPSEYISALSEEIKLENERIALEHQKILACSFFSFTGIASIFSQSHPMRARFFILGTACTTLSSVLAINYLGQKRSIEAIEIELKDRYIILPKE